MVSSGSMVSVPDSSLRSWWVCNSLTGEFPYSLGNGAACSTGRPGLAVPEHAQARKRFQWKPIAGYLMLALVTNGYFSRSRRGGLVGFKSRKSTTGHPVLPLQSSRKGTKTRFRPALGAACRSGNELEVDLPGGDIGGNQPYPDLGAGLQLP